MFIKHIPFSSNKKDWGKKVRGKKKVIKNNVGNRQTFKKK